jgi:hypothetical protein
MAKHYRNSNMPPSKEFFGDMGKSRAGAAISAVNKIMT